MDYLLEVKNLSLKFIRDHKKANTYGLKSLIRSLLGLPQKYKTMKNYEFLALDNVSFSVKRGETIGLLGLNGSGKSSLLKVISNLLQPDEGSVLVNAKIDALIELGAGFHPMFSGRQNIQMRLAVQGFDKESSEKIIQEIIDFSELAEYIDAPVKTYSSGMYSKLGFSCAVFGKPDILLVDEVLSVGDFRFRQKCLDKINEIKKHTSVILVSHSLSTIKMFCDRCLVLQKSKLVFDGSTAEALQYYLETSKDSNLPNAENKNFMGPEFNNAKKVKFIKCEILDLGMQAVDTVDSLTDFIISLQIQFVSKPENLILGIPFWDSAQEFKTAINSDVLNPQFYIDQNNLLRLKIKVNNSFNAGQYYWAIAVQDGVEYLHREHLRSFSIKNSNPRLMGDFQLPHQWL